MTVITSNFIVTGTMRDVPVYANTMSATNGYSNISVMNDLHIDGNVFASKRMDGGTTLFGTFMLASNLPFDGSNEIPCTNNSFVLDFPTTNMNGMSDVPLSVATSNVYNPATGVITVPTSGLYSLAIQGSFSNSAGHETARNGVYYYFPRHPHPNARRAANINVGPIVSATHTEFFLGGDTLKPMFYSDDSNATLLSGNNETFIRFTVLGTTTPNTSNFVRP